MNLALPPLVLVTSLFLAEQLALGSSHAEPGSERGGVGLQVEPRVGWSFGHSAYTLRFNAPDPADPEALLALRSELVFPLDVPLAGARVAWTPGPWSFGATMQTNLGEPGAPMTNRDFVDDREFIHAESQAQLSLWMVTVESRRALAVRPHVSVELVALLDYRRIGQYIVGYEGWRSSIFTDARVEFSDIGPVLDYTVHTLEPRAGVQVARSLGGGVELALQGTVGPAIAWDRDDHLRRGRQSVGHGVGPAASGLAQVELRPSFVEGHRLAIRVRGGLDYARAVGVTNQSFDDGTVYADIPYVIERLQPELGLGLALSL